MPQLNLHDLQSNKPEIKYHCAKRAIALSEKKPKALYPDLNTFMHLLDGDNNVLRWTALIVLGNLAAADSRGSIARLVPKLMAFTRDKSLITASNAVNALGKIALHKPRLRTRILHGVLGIEKTTYFNKGEPSPECRNVVIGHLLDVLAQFEIEALKRKEIASFIRRQTKNTRYAVKQRAQALLHKL